MQIQTIATNWKLIRETDQSEYTCTLPCDNLSVLLTAGAVPDPYYADNELVVQWVGDEEWTFSTEFELDKTFLQKSQLFLQLDRIDTFSEVYLNEVKVGSTKNMFIRYRFDVSRAVRAGNNRLRIRLASPVQAAVELKKQLPYPVPHQDYPVQAQGRNLIRKVQSHAGWDWGPCLMVSGIYEQVLLCATPLERIEAVHHDAALTETKEYLWHLKVYTEIFSREAGHTLLRVECAGAVSEQQVELRPGPQQVISELEVKNPQLWWPSGYGQQPLYELRVVTPNDTSRQNIGFRSIEVLTEPDDYGIGMVFRINGRNIFAKGANWIPPDALPARHSPKHYEQLLESARQANMNMIRVWGGGQYEYDYFYDICDRKGLLVWQDFMFSCALYPSSPDFLENVRGEAEYQIKRLKHHPSLVLWCGNNEDIGALTWFKESRENRDRYIIDYDRLNEGVLGRAVRKLDLQRKWWSSSPSAGEGDYSDCWHDDSKGDMHYWSVWHEGKPFEAYYEATPRFCSEFGFQSFPSVESIRNFTPPEQLNITSPAMEHHQKNERGNSIIISTISRYFRFPQSFEEIIYLSRVQQAMAIQTAVEYWRSRRPVCMGMLYWQLNDNWPVASWSSLEYEGAWKPLHYSAKRFYAPRHIALIFNTDKIEVHGINDNFEALSGSLQLDLYTFDGKLVQHSLETSTLPAESSSLLKTVAIPADREFRATHFYYARFTPDTPNILPLENSRLLMRPKECSIHPTTIRSEIIHSAEGIKLRLRSDTPAFFVVLEFEGLETGALHTGPPEDAAPVRFSDNNFTLLPNCEKWIDIVVDGNAALFEHTAETLKQTLKIHALRSF